MTSQLDHDRLLACLDEALATAERLDNTLVAAMIVECICAVGKGASPQGSTYPRARPTND